MARRNNNAISIGGAAQSISVVRKKVATERGSFKREDSNYDIEKRLTKIEQDLAQLRADIKSINDKIVIVQKVTRDRNGKETIVVKQS